MGIDPVLLAAKALDGLYLRGAALAHNLANSNAPQFRALNVDFEAALRRAAATGPAAVASLTFSSAAGAMFKPGDERRADLLLVDAASNAARFATIADLTARRLALVAATAGSRG